MLKRWVGGRGGWEAGRGGGEGGGVKSGRMGEGVSGRLRVRSGGAVLRG